ncbi:hypothetical protein Tco_0536400 [Tanacetum coccineum]
MDDLYKNLNIYEAEVMGSSSTSQNTQSVGFVSLNSTDNTNEAVKTAHGVSAANPKANTSTLLNVDSLSDAMIYSFFTRAYKACLESVEARLDVYKKNEAVFEEDIKILKLDLVLRDNALTELRKKLEKAKKERDD